jgi:hypothetical protein
VAQGVGPEFKSQYCKKKKFFFNLPFLHMSSLGLGLQNMLLFSKTGMIHIQKWDISQARLTHIILATQETDQENCCSRPARASSSRDPVLKNPT